MSHVTCHMSHFNFSCIYAGTAVIPYCFVNANYGGDKTKLYNICCTFMAHHIPSPPHSTVNVTFSPSGSIRAYRVVIFYFYLVSGEG